MDKKPNFLILLADQMQGAVLNPDHACSTPNLDRIARRGLRFTRAYTPNPVCSPARASLMTGLLPHNHGVCWVTHTVDRDQGLLRKDFPHWAQHLQNDGYQTAYFGKWHVERENRPQEFGWEIFNPGKGKAQKTKQPGEKPATPGEDKFVHSHYYQGPEGYPDRLQFGVLPDTDEDRDMKRVAEPAMDYLRDTAGRPEPWCCCISFYEPHDPYLCKETTFEAYRKKNIPLPENRDDPMRDKPNLYRRSAEVFSNIDKATRIDAAACYYASITEADEYWGRILDVLEESGDLDNTVIIFTSDHGDLLGAHGMYCKNISAFEEIYHIPLLMAGPGITENQTTSLRVGLHDLCPTILDLAGAAPIEHNDSHTFLSILGNPAGNNPAFRSGYAEYHGGRIFLTQRIYWEDEWKFVFNGFDYDELYNLSSDPWEMENLARNPKFKDRLDIMMRGLWKKVMATDDQSLINTSYPPLRFARCGPYVDERDTASNP